MEIQLKRIARKPTYTIGRLSINGHYICDTLEPTDRGLEQNMTLDEIKSVKIKGKTAIPAGRYKVIMSYSPKFKKTLPLLLNVPAFSRILIHAGNTAKDTQGCILCGKNIVVGKVLYSTTLTQIIIKIINKRVSYHAPVYITIK